jgi:ribosomal protein L31E
VAILPPAKPLNRMTKQKIFLTLSILNLYSCKTENKTEFDQIKFIKNLKIETIETTQYPCKFGEIDYKDGFVTEITTFDTNGYVINMKKFHREDYMKEYNSEVNYTYSNNYKISKIEKYNHKHLLDQIYIDSSLNEKIIQRKIYNSNQKLINLIKYKYENKNLIEYIVYDSTGNIESKNVNSYANDKLIESITYDEFDHVKNRTIIEYTNNLITSKSYDKDDKLQYQSQSTNYGNLTFTNQSTYIYEKDTTNYKVEYTYQDSIFYKTNKHYKNNELDYIEEFRLNKRK